uniref:Uncharacterized protein n=1 Tax=Oryza nivara TaxID=4536 RepID=A0A0E0J6Q1_ORYNI
MGRNPVLPKPNDPKRSDSKHSECESNIAGRMAVAEPSPPAAVAAAAGQTHAGRVDALERMLTRLALTEDSVASLLCRFLPYTTISLVSPGASVRELLMENGSLFDKLVKQRPDISMMMDLWRIYTESTSTVVQNYCIVYVEMGFERLLSEDKGSIAPDLLINISNVPEQHQGIILRLVLKAIGEWDTHKVDQTVASKYKSISASNDGLVFADFCLHMILYQTPPQGIRCPAGLSVAQSDRVTGNLPLKGDTLASRKLGILDVIETMQFKLEIVYPLYLAAASDSQEAVAKRGEEMLILKASAVNLEDSDLIKRLFTLFNGTASSENIASELEVAPAHSSLRVRLMGVFCRSIAAANAFTHTFQCIFGCIYGNGTTSRLKQLGMEFTVWVFKHATNKQLKAISPFILSGILHSLDGSSTTEADSSSRDIRIFAYQAIGLLAFRMPNLFCNKTGMAIRLFTALRLEEQSLRSIIQEAATALATAYKGASVVILKDLEALLLENSQMEQSEVRFSAVRWAVTLYNMKHCPSRYICMLGASDVKLDIREMALAGLNLLNDERQSSTMATDISYPDIAEMVNYIYSQQPQLLHCYEQRNGKLLFPTDTFLAMIKFLMKCFNTHDGSDFLQEDLSNSTLAKMCVLLEHAMSYDGSSELHTLALKSLVDISSRQPKMVSSFYVNRLDWPRTLLHADTHEEAPRYGRQCQNTTDINEELGSCCNGRTNHSLEHEVCGGGNNSDNLGGDGCDEELVTGCHHRHGRIDHNLEFLIDRMMSWSVRDILKAPPVIKKAQTTFVSIDNYFESLCIEAVALTTAQLKMPLQLLGTANWHDVNKCHTIRRGDLILLDPTSPYSKKPKGCFFAVAVEDEDEYFRSAFKVQIIRKSRPVDLVINYAALLDINIQGQVEFWSSIHQDIDNKCQCIINSILQAPLVIWLPKLCLHNESTTKMIKVLDEIEDLLGNRNLSDGSMRKAFEVEAAVQTFDTGDCGIAEELNDKRMKCAQLLRKFKEDLQSIDLPTFKTREDLEEFCMKNSSIIFCSTNNSFHLREIQLKIDCLIIDSANLFNEYETLVPLCLPSLHSIILAGDEAKKPTVGNQRLLDLGFNQHLLLDQYITGQHGRRVSSKSKVLKPEFTWIARPHNRKYILAPIRDQGPKDFNVILDIQDMLLQYKEETGYTYGDELRGERGQIRLEKALQTLKKRGVRGIDGCDNDKKMEQIRISSFRRIDIEAEGFEQIFERLLQGRMLVGSFKVSCNYFELAEGEVYHYDYARPIVRDGVTWSHAVMFVGFGDPAGDVLLDNHLAAIDTCDFELERMKHNSIGHLVYQNSYGKLFGFPHFRCGYGRVGLQSIVSVWEVTV